MPSLQKKIAVITSASSGIGLAIAVLGPHAFPMQSGVLSNVPPTRPELSQDP